MIISSAAIIYHNGKYLLQKRDKNKKTVFPNFWGLFGGLIVKNENPLNGLKRELQEELNLKIIFLKQILSLNIQLINISTKRKRIYFECRLPKSYKEKILLNEGQKYDFFKLKKINDLEIIPWDLAAINYHFLFRVKKKEKAFNLSQD